MTITICFDPSVFQIFPPLLAGSSIVITDSLGHLDPDYIAMTFVEHKVTHLLGSVPTLVRLHGLMSGFVIMPDGCRWIDTCMTEPMRCLLHMIGIWLIYGAFLHICRSKSMLMHLRGLGWPRTP